MGDLLAAPISCVGVSRGGGRYASWEGAALDLATVGFGDGRLNRRSALLGHRSARGSIGFWSIHLDLSQPAVVVTKVLRFSR